MNSKVNKDSILNFFNKTNLSASAVIQFDKCLDEFFGIPQNREISTSNYEDLSNEALSTSYRDYWQILKLLDRGESLLDLGAGFCRGSLLVDLLKLDVNCISVEIDDSRLFAASKVIDNKKTVIQADLFSNNFKIPKRADAIFLYMPEGKFFFRIMELLIEAKRHLKIFVIESHGHFIPTIDRFQSVFLNKKVIGKCSIDRLDNNIYQYDFKPNDLSSYELELFKIYTATRRKDCELRIIENAKAWVTSSFNVDFFIDNKNVYLETVKPRRMVNIKDVSIEIHSKSKLCEWFETQNQSVMKIYLNPPIVEYIDGTIKSHFDAFIGQS